MSLATILAPVFVQVALTFALLIWQGRLRVAAIRGGELHIRDIALGQPNWPLRATQVANAYRNQFELPVLFYLAIVIAIALGPVSPAFVALSWLFVAARLAHACVHVTTNNVPRRFLTFTAGLAILIALWVVLLATVLFR